MDILKFMTLGFDRNRFPASSFDFSMCWDLPRGRQRRQTRKVLELLLEKGFSASVLTKSDLAVRDIDIFSKMDNASNSISAAFNDNRTRSLFEDNTVDTEKRIAALAGSRRPVSERGRSYVRSFRM
jgi:hypothetical protein